MNSGLYPWANTMLGPIRICRVFTDLTLENCDPQNWLNVDAAPDVCSEPRLDPFEFHGRRRSNTVPQSPPAAGDSNHRKSKRIHGPV